MKNKTKKTWTKKEILSMIKEVKNQVIPDAYWERGWQAACYEMTQQIKDEK